MRIFTQVLDGTFGRVAVGVRASLARASDNEWTIINSAITDRAGRIDVWADWPLERGLYRIVFDTDVYFAELGTSTAYPEVAVIFRILDESHAFQIQVTLGPYSYSTYFGTTDGHAEA